MLPRVDVGVITWNSAALTAEALGKMLDSDQGADLRLLVWDNASTDGTPGAIRAVAPQADVFENEENVGFARALNGLMARSEAPWFLALNSDAWPEPGAVGRMVEAALRHPRTAAVAPRLLRPDGSLEHSTHRFPSVGLAAVDALGLRGLIPRHLGDALCLEGAWAHDRCRRVDWAVGAAMLFPRAALEDVGPFDERFFMYNEDVEWCFRARQGGLEVWFEPAAVVRHVGNASGSRRFGDRRASLDARNLHVFLNEALGPRRAALYRGLETVALGRSFARAKWSAHPDEQAHWRLQLKATLGFVPPPVLADPRDPLHSRIDGGPDGALLDGDPLVTVVVPTRNRPARVKRLLRVLEHQSLPPEQFQVIVVDDSSTDDTWAALRAAQQSSPLNLRVLRTQRHSGPAAARNLGWREASAPVVAFTDDDCLPEPKWLEAGLANLDGDARLVVGRTMAPTDQLFLIGEPFARAMEVDGPDLFETCNVFYRRRDLEVVGGFDERFRRPSGEDTHLGLRVTELGVEPVFAEDAVVRHDVRPGGVLAALEEATRWVDLPLVLKGRAYARRGRAYKILFWKRSHPPAMLAGAGLALALRWRPALLLAVPWLHYRLQHDPVSADLRRRLVYLPAALALDLTEVAVMIRGSVRHRALLL